METFVLRVWTPFDACEQAEACPLHGLVEHVRSGDRASFAGAEDLFAFLADAVAASGTSGERHKGSRAEKEE